MSKSQDFVVLCGWRRHLERNLHVNMPIVEPLIVLEKKFRQKRDHKLNTLWHAKKLSRPLKKYFNFYSTKTKMLQKNILQKKNYETQKCLNLVLCKKKSPRIS